MRTTTLRAVPSTLLSHSRPPPRLSSLLLSSFKPTATQNRLLFDSLLSSTLGPAPLRHLTHTQTLPYHPALLFKTVSSIEAYPAFLPFTVSSDVTSRDAVGYPTRAKLKVGYAKFGMEEDWDSIVRCDADAGIVEARSAETGSGDGLFEVLRTRWEIKSLETEDEAVDVQRTTAKLDLHVQFRNPVYDQMFARVEGNVAGMVIRAFEKRVAELANAEK